MGNGALFFALLSLSFDCPFGGSHDRQQRGLESTEEKDPSNQTRWSWADHMNASPQRSQRNRASRYQWRGHTL
ncbi:MAG: hypothetical protein R3F11_26800 [Verrucomicrobiales bacterium]